MKPVDWKRESDAWVDNNPGYWRRIVAAACELGRRQQRFGFALIREHIRYLITLDEPGGSEFNINNNMSPHLTRRLLCEHPWLSEFVTCRKTNEERSAERSRNRETKPARGLF